MLTDHRRFEDRAPACTLPMFIDDATSRLMHLKSAISESTFSYSGALEAYLARLGRPVAFHSDRHTAFRVANQDEKTGHGMTQFGRAPNEPNVEILRANGSQAKGRGERANRTRQDRPVKELRPADVTGIDKANAFLPGFVERRTMRFTKTPHGSDNLHRTLDVEPHRLRDILCCRDERHVGNQLALSCDRFRIIPVENEITGGLPGKYVDTCEFADGRLEFRRGPDRRDEGHASSRSSYG